MGNHWKKTISILCIAGLTATVVGCGKSAAPDGSNASQGGSATGGTTQYTFFRNLSAPEYPEDGGMARQLIDQAAAKAGIPGFDYKVTMNSGPDYFTKLNLMAASGDLPDFFDIDIPTLTKFVDEGLVMPLDDLLKNSPHIMQYMRQEDFQASTINGKIYGIPAGFRKEPFNQPNVSGILIRKDWLQNVGLKEPVTLEDYHKVLQAFTNNDPDGDGKKDTYGMGGNKNDYFDGVFGAFGINPFFWFEDGGTIKKGFTLPQTKQALAVLQQWYKEGLIDPQFPVEETKQMQSNITNSIIGSYGGQAYDISATNAVWKALQAANPKYELEFIAPPKGPDGKVGWPDVAPGGKLEAVNAKVKDPQKLFKFLDWSVTDEDEGGGFLLREGVEGKQYTYDKAANKVTTVGASEQQKDGFSNPVKFITVADRRWAEQNVRDAIQLAGTYVIKNQLWTTVPAQLDYPDLETKLWPEYFVKIVTGEWPVDKWDEFVQKYYAQGGKTIEQQANDAWKKTKK